MAQKEHSLGEPLLDTHKPTHKPKEKSWVSAFTSLLWNEQAEVAETTTPLTLESDIGSDSDPEEEHETSIFVDGASEKKFYENDPLVDCFRKIIRGRNSEIRHIAMVLYENKITAFKDVKRKTQEELKQLALQVETGVQARRQRRRQRPRARSLTPPIDGDGEIQLDSVSLDGKLDGRRTRGGGGWTDTEDERQPINVFEALTILHNAEFSAEPTSASRFTRVYSRKDYSPPEWCWNINMQDQKSFIVPSTNLPTAKLCMHDNKNIAEFFCLDCKKYFCPNCDRIQHLPTTHIKHTRERYSGLKLCVHDGVNAAKIVCLDCNNKTYCEECDKWIHLPEEMNDHRREEMEGDKETKDQGQYFVPDLGEAEIGKKELKLICVVVPCFNEDAHELRRTFQSLADQSQKLRTLGYEMHVLLVVDGWFKTSLSMRQYIQCLFPEEATDRWSKKIKAITVGRERECVETFTLQRTNETFTRVFDVDISQMTASELADQAEEKIENEGDGEEEHKDDNELIIEGKQEVGIDIATHLQNGSAPPQRRMSHSEAMGMCSRMSYYSVLLGFIIFAIVCGFMMLKDEDNKKYWQMGLESASGVIGFLLLGICYGVLKKDRLQHYQPQTFLKVTCLIKRDNRRKHNSHNWFFAAFCAFYKPTYAFCTDCGTKYDENCLFELVKYLDANPSVTATTGRQRVMTAEDQGSEGEGILERLYRSAQCFDYEASLAAYMGAFAFAGMLPVIPGPCGLYRWGAIQDAAKFYLKTVEKNPDETGLVEGSLLLAEDRILSYAAVLKCERDSSTAYVPTAVFYFEAENRPAFLLQQRRRWINGTVAGYIWLLWTNSNVLWKSKKNVFFKAAISLLVFCQFSLYLIVALAPGIFTLSVHFALNQLFSHSGNWNTVLVVVYFGIYVVFVQQHGQKGAEYKLKEWLFHLASLVNALGILLVFSTTIWYAYTNGFNLQLGIVFGTMFFPFLLAFLHDWESFGLMIITAIPFYLFLPTMVAYFAAYAFARSWELTWGNRPSDRLESMQQARPKTQAQLEEDQRKLYQQAKSISYIIVALNFLLVIAISEIQTLQPAFIIAMSAVIVLFAFLQMCLSFLWFIFFYWPYRFWVAIVSCCRRNCC